MRLFVVAALGMFCIAAIIAVTGGFRGHIGPFPFSAQRPTSVAICAWLMLVLGSLRLGPGAANELAATICRWFGHRTTHVALGCVAATVSVAFARGAFVAAGADPYGYVSQALLWAAGNPVQLQPLKRFLVPSLAVSKSFAFHLCWIPSTTGAICAEAKHGGTAVAAIDSTCLARLQFCRCLVCMLCVLSAI
jgi:hypothetical protein